MSGLTILDYEGPSPKQWHLCIRGARNSWESWEKGDSWIDDRLRDERFALGPADLDLALRLARLGPDHGKFLRQLPVIVEVKAPGYWWREFDTYRIGVEASDITQNSTSMMHTLGKQEMTEDMVYMPDVPNSERRVMLLSFNRIRDVWIASGKRKGPDVPQWVAMQQALPFGILYTRTVSLNYQVLRSIYHARKNHRLAEWRSWCAWCATLEHSALITEAK